MSTNCGCEPKKYNISLGCCVPVVAPADQYYTKYQTDKKIEEAISGITGTTGCCITPEEVESAITSAMTIVEGEIPSLDGYATEQWVLDKHYITGVDLSDYATKEEIPVVPTSNTAFTNDAGYLTEHQAIKTINGQSLIGTGDIEIGTGGTIDLSNYYTTAQTVSLVESAVTRVEGEIPSLSGYATEQWVQDQHYISGVDLSDYALKSEIPTVPTNVSAFNNDAGYLTQHQSLSAYSTTQEVTNMINQSASGKVDTTTYNSYTASTQTTINSKADSSTLNNYLLKNKIWCGTQSQYDSIQNKDSETLYLIHE